MQENAHHQSTMQSDIVHHLMSGTTQKRSPTAKRIGRVSEITITQGFGYPEVRVGITSFARNISWRKKGNICKQKI